MVVCIYASVTDGENNRKHDRDNSRHKAEHPECWNGRAIHNWNLLDTVYLNPDKISGQEKAAFFATIAGSILLQKVGIMITE